MSIINGLKRIYRNMEIREHRLLYLFLEITRKCNLSCLHCGSDCKSDNKAPHLTTESWKKIITYVASNFSKELVFVITGGEPLLHPDLEGITSFIQEAGRRWGMVTNGLILTPPKLTSLIANGLYSITVSLDGPEKPHNLLRGNNKAFKQTISALKNISRRPIPLKDVVTCVYPENLECLEETAEILLTLKIPAWRLFRIFPAGRSENNKELLLDRDETWRLINWIRENKKHYARKGLEINYSCEGWFPHKIEKKLRTPPVFCRAGINIASILCDGTITGCSNNHTSFARGNILKDNFKQLWEYGFEDFRERRWLKNTECADCLFLTDCRGGAIHLWQKGEEKPRFCYKKNDQTY